MFVAQFREVKKVQTLMGHSSVKLTYDTYGYLFDDSANDREAADAMENSVLHRLG